MSQDRAGVVVLFIRTLTISLVGIQERETKEIKF